MERGPLTSLRFIFSEADREKIKRIDSGLDEVQSELQLSAVYITRFVKRLATDKIIIAFAFLLVLGVAGIIAYSAINPGQSVRRRWFVKRALKTFLTHHLYRRLMYQALSYRRASMFPAA